jgi:hypothetical protein
MQLLPNEEILVSSNQDKVILTNQRIHLSDSEWGKSYQITIFLEDISSIEMLYKSNPLLLVLAAVCFLVGLFTPSPGYENNGTLRVGGFMLSIILLVLFEKPHGHYRLKWGKQTEFSRRWHEDAGCHWIYRQGDAGKSQ